MSSLTPAQSINFGNRKGNIARGYDAEGSYSPDGQWIVFTSMRDAYNRRLTEAEKKQLETDPSYFGEIYIMRADGSEQKRLTQVAAAETDGTYTAAPDGSATDTLRASAPEAFEPSARLVLREKHK